MDLAQNLVRAAVRSFYETKQTLIINALITYSALRDDDLAYLMSMNTKDLHKACAALRDARFLAVHVRSEPRPGQQRPVNRTYYYIDYRQAIDYIKWRVYRIDKDMQGPTVPANEKKEYFCARCKSEWTQLEVLDNVGPTGFLCHRCGYVLARDVERESSGHQKSTRMNNQFKFITEQLPKIDEVIIPDNTFEMAFKHAREVIRDATHQIEKVSAADFKYRPTAVKGEIDIGPTKLNLQLSSTNGPTAEEIAAEQARKEKIAQQNALPSWMSNSTVTGEAFRTTDAVTGLAKTSKVADVKDSASKATEAVQDSAIEDYFERVKQQAKLEAFKQTLQPEEESSDEEDEDDFEDVVATGSNNSGGGTPAGAAGNPTGLAPVVPSPLRQSSMKREASSGASTGVNSPASDVRPAKKVKVEEPPPAEDDESEEDVEFEDV